MTDDERRRRIWDEAVVDLFDLVNHHDELTCEEIRDSIRDTLRSFLASSLDVEGVAEREWQTIDTAPKQPFKRLFLACVTGSDSKPAVGFTTVGYWTNEDTRWVTPEQVQPTHWLPLPTPPQRKE